MLSSTACHIGQNSRPLLAKARAIGICTFVLGSLCFAKPALAQQARFTVVDKVELTETSNESADASTAAKPTPKPKSPPSPTLGVDVTEWVVFVADVANPTMNARDLFRSNLPECVGDTRGVPISSELQKASQIPIDAADIIDAQPALPIAKGANASQSADAAPCPVGVIRFSADGPVDKQTKIDVQIGFSGGQTLGHWPRGQTRWAGLLWEESELRHRRAQEQNLPEGSWLASLRGGGLPIADNKTRESFLLYDVAVRYPLHVVLSSHEPGKYVFSHTMDAPLHDVSIYKRDGDHWLTASVAGPPADAGSASKPDAAAPEVANDNGIAKDKEIAFTLAPAAADKLLEPWRGRLAAAGVTQRDQAVVLNILARYAFDPNRLTGIYRMDSAELDRLLPLEIVPQPKKISRIALVIVRGMDPALNAELDTLIKQLGDPSWKVSRGGHEIDSQAWHTGQNPFGSGPPTARIPKWRIGRNN